MGMSKALSVDLRERVVAAIAAGSSCRAAAVRFGVSAASAVRWAALEQNPNNQSHWGFPWASKSDSPCWLGTEASLHGENPV